MLSTEYRDVELAGGNAFGQAERQKNLHHTCDLLRLHLRVVYSSLRERLEHLRGGDGCAGREEGDEATAEIAEGGGVVAFGSAAPLSLLNVGQRLLARVPAVVPFRHSPHKAQRADNVYYVVNAASVDLKGFPHNVKREEHVFISVEESEHVLGRRLDAVDLEAEALTA